MTRSFCSGVLLSPAWDIIGESDLSHSCLKLIASVLAESHLIPGFHVEVPRRFSYCPKLAIVQMQRFPMVRPFWVLPYSKHAITVTVSSSTMVLPSCIRIRVSPPHRDGFFSHLHTRHQDFLRKAKINPAWNNSNLRLPPPITNNAFLLQVKTSYSTRTSPQRPAKDCLRYLPNSVHLLRHLEAGHPHLH